MGQGAWSGEFGIESRILEVEELNIQYSIFNVQRLSAKSQEPKTIEAS